MKKKILAYLNRCVIKQIKTDLKLNNKFINMYGSVETAMVAVPL